MTEPGDGDAGCIEWYSFFESSEKTGGASVASSDWTGSSLYNFLVPRQLPEVNANDSCVSRDRLHVGVHLRSGRAAGVVSETAARSRGRRAFGRRAEVVVQLVSS
jgi:hypothetical protein